MTSAIWAPDAGGAGGFDGRDDEGVEEVEDDGALEVAGTVRLGSGSSTVARAHPAINNNTAISPVRRMPLG